jgi:quinol monooxygenase YgiN
MSIVRMAGTMKLDHSDLDEVVEIFKIFIKDVQEKDYGVLAYHYFIDEDPLLIHVIEWYESPQAMLDHYANIDLEAAGRLLGLVQLGPFNYFGHPTPEQEATMSGFGKVLIHRPLVSIEQTTVQT